MITIKSIHIQNFRSIVDETIEFSHFNIFVGKNDSGKSNVLKALNLFFNGKTDYNTPFNFANDYSQFAKHGAKQAKEIIISVEINIPETYKDKGTKTWIKKWRNNTSQPYADNINSLFKSNSRVLTFLKRIEYIYIPAVKSNEYFRYLLAQVYQSMTKTADTELKKLNDEYSNRLKSLTIDLTNQIRSVLNLESSIRMPQNLNNLFGDLSFSTSDKSVKNIDLSLRGDGIKARHIPSILRYMQQNIEKNKPKKAISGSYIWGFEEPENGVEYLSCFEMAKELYSYRDNRQIFITTHSPAFYMNESCDDAKCFYVHKTDNGLSHYDTNKEVDFINREIGFLPLVAPMISKELDAYLQRESKLKESIYKLTKDFKNVTDKVIIITEGKTDIKHLRTAFTHLNLDAETVAKIDYYDFGDRDTLGDGLTELLAKLSKMSNVSKIIGIFDRDKHVIEPPEGCNYIALGNNVFRFNIPPLTTPERINDSRVCIEHYYSDDEIHTKTNQGQLYQGKDFDKFGKSSDGCWIFKDRAKNREFRDMMIIDSRCSHLQAINDVARMITKDQFAEYVATHPEEFDFCNFRKIYDIIVEIMNAK